MKRYNRNTRDANEPELIKLAWQLGACCHEDSPLDWWVWVPRLGKWMPVEIKIPEREGTANEYTPAQKRFRTWCTANGAPWWVWRTDADVLRDMGAR